MALEQNTDMIIIKTIDGVNIPFIKAVIKQSKTISDMFDVNEDDTYIPLLNEKCTENIMILIKDFMMYLHNNPNEIENLTEYINSNSSYLSEWLKNYISANNHILFDIVVVSDYLDINILTNFICREIATRISNTTPDEMSAFFQ